MVQGVNDRDEFTPRPGRVRSRGDASAKRYLARIQAGLAKLGRTGLKRGQGFSGTRIGRGAGVGHVATRHPFDRFRARRVIVKVHIARARGVSGAGALRAHVSYIQRDGVERDGTPGQLYDRASDEADGKAFVERASDDRHQFRLIVSPEDAEALGDLKPFTREIMARAEADLGTKLDWVAVDHFNTAHPHTHIVIRGKEPFGKDLVIAKDYLIHGFRKRASEIALEELGPRRDLEIGQMRRREVDQHRFTSLDRELVAVAERGVLSLSEGRGPYARFSQALALGRLKTLERLGLVRAEAPDRWRLSEDLEPKLRALGRRGDIINEMARLTGTERGAFAIFDPSDGRQSSVLGEIIGQTGADELRGARALILAGVDGRTWHVDVGVRELGALAPNGAIVEITPRRAGPRPADRVIADIAERSDGIYSEALHAEQDPSTTAAFRRAHVRRLEALRRVGIVRRAEDGRWRIPPDYRERALAFDARRGAGLSMTVRSWLPLEQLVARDAVTWLDAGADAAFRGARGFGRDVEDALARRRAWLIENGWVKPGEGLDAGTKARLQAAEWRSETAAISNALGKPFTPSEPGTRIEGRFMKGVDMALGRFAVIERARDFTLAPWREVLESRRGQAVMGLMREAGVNWRFGKTRGPSR